MVRGGTGWGGMGNETQVTIKLGHSPHLQTRKASDHPGVVTLVLSPEFKLTENWKGNF